MLMFLVTCVSECFIAWNKGDIRQARQSWHEVFFEREDHDKPLFGIDSRQGNIQSDSEFPELIAYSCEQNQYRLPMKRFTTASTRIMATTSPQKAPISRR